MAKIPLLKKKIGSFLAREEGRITKENLVKAGVVLSAVALVSLEGVDAGHSDSHDNRHGNSPITLASDAAGATGAHTHNLTNTHSSHNSHSNHSSGGWC